MASALTKMLSYIPWPTSVNNFFLGRWTKELGKEFLDGATDKFLELLLGGMDISLLFSKDYRRNIEGFEGRYLFLTKEDKVKASAVFKNGDMKVYKEGIKNADVTVTFKNANALRKFLFSQNQDILDSLLANEVETTGNVNYIMKFGFMARDLLRRIGVQP